MPKSAPLSETPNDQVIRQVLAEAGNEDIGGLGERDLKHLAERLWTFASTSSGPKQSIQCSEFTPAAKDAAPRTLLEIVGPDRPFLVDSILGVCTALGHQVKTLFHPIVRIDEATVLSTVQVHLPVLSAGETSRLKAELSVTLEDIRLATGDYLAMRKAMQEESYTIAGLVYLKPAERDEAVAFLNWLANEHFVFLGMRRYNFARNADGTVLPEEPEMIDGSNLGVLRDESRNVLNRGAEPAILTPAIGEFLNEPAPLIIAKSTMVSNVHRRAHADYVGIKHYDHAGKVCGETRFVGLFTAEAYTASVRSVPLIRKRADAIIAASGASPSGHSAKAISNIIEGWPRDELFQTGSTELTPLVLGALHLIGRPRTRVFTRYDRFGRFVTVLAHVSREAYDTDLRQRMTTLFESAFNGDLIEFQPRFDASPMARVEFRIALAPDHPRPDPAELERRIDDLARTWDGSFRDAISGGALKTIERQSALCFVGAFNAAYREAFRPEEAMRDVDAMSLLAPDTPVRVRAYTLPGDEAGTIRAKIYARSGAIPLSKCVPVLENMGLFVESETGYPVRPVDAPADDAPDTYWVHALNMRTRGSATFDLETLAAKFEAAFVAVWAEEAENDGFNRLVLTAGADWREAALLRAMCGFRRQSGSGRTRPTQIRALTSHPAIARLILDLFVARFNPDGAKTLAARQTECDKICADIETALTDVSALDEDQVLRRLSELIMAMQRTNFYQRSADGKPRPFISFKIASRDLQDLPDPKPYREIYTSSPMVEGVHLRFGAVARGGLRWSDRREDYRTEVLGLVKAQQVKNAVIVPVGSKGGFFPHKLPPQSAGRDAWMDAGITAYKEFITALLDLTDNLQDGSVIAPENTVRWDDEDPYLVVAADKGTATFSDIANKISTDRGFWLGDAFASGGSAGYDHKKMGITARGGWEAVKRHFREAGKDIQTEPFTVIGVGDMGGDVFGNGMLLSRQIKLLAAFNHLHIFIDPAPDNTEACWKERNRLFEERGGWDQYNTKLISKGGGVFNRSAKSIPLSDEMKAMTGLSADSVTPTQLLKAILAAQAELLWFGGIGTYVKAAQETHADVGDRANDALRVDATELKAKVIGEGANLGMTQSARIEFALSGGRVNSDAIDNSAGVDSSDHEVNIKILCGEAIRLGTLKPGDRNDLLASMTDDVAAHVLAHNYAQTGALSLAESTAKADHDALERQMLWLEKRGVLNRVLEELPSTSDMRVRAEERQWLTRPELAVILAWSKITLFDDIVASDVPDDPFFERALNDYFPAALHDFSDAQAAHRLKREIISTVLANRLLDVCGPAMLLRLREASGAAHHEIVRAFEAARELLHFDGFYSEIDTLDTAVPASLQTELRLLGIEGLFAATTWLLSTHKGDQVGKLVETYKDRLNAFRSALRDAASPFIASRIERRARSLTRKGAPEPLARWAAAMRNFADGLNVAALSKQSGTPVEDVATTFYAIGEGLRLDRLIINAEDSLQNAPYWDRVATRRTVDDLVHQQGVATQAAVKLGGADKWLADRSTSREQLISTLKAMGKGRDWSFAKFALSADAVRRFIAE